MDVKLDVRISVRLWSRHAPIPNFAAGTGLSFCTQKKMTKGGSGSSSEYYATTGDIKESSLAGTLKALSRLYEGILASPELAEMVVGGDGRGEVWVVSFGEAVELKCEIPQSLAEKIVESRVSLYVENYPQVEDANPSGGFLFKFE